MVIAIVYLYSIGNADSKAEVDICFLIAGAWALISFAYVAITSVKRSYSLKMVSAMIRPDMLNVLVDVLKDEDLILGMTVTKVHGFGRQKGHLEKDAERINDKISFIPKVRVDLVVNDWDVPSIMEIIQDTLFTGGVGDGKIFVFDAVDAMRVSTGEKGVLAV
jgi:nitrogen regulatory protein PII